MKNIAVLFGAMAFTTYYKNHRDSESEYLDGNIYQISQFWRTYFDNYLDFR